MTEFMVVTQVICAAGVLLLGIVTSTGRITKSLREEMDKKVNSLHVEMRADREVIFGEIKSLREEMHAGFSTLREEMRTDRMAVFGEIKSLREEMHDMNGRLGQVEGHMSISAANSSKESQ